MLEILPKMLSKRIRAIVNKMLIFLSSLIPACDRASFILASRSTRCFPEARVWETQAPGCTLEYMKRVLLAFLVTTSLKLHIPCL